ncbi:D-alanyl-D-alanine carboxypeptidase (penicillin-binding protein 5/6) [Tranquillimonas rosea]|uniref:serine-type D-Ala-D-Ala carboxypeptidase n=1 Tax=Tranquillimonas rosea TaxID=641238 RepID=A0A1H9WFZ7_9RHOB|nr:D-alanyl-D-alanine carboxypeptidase family protein [Tranquillimonas rosea]SES32846.1 D-alanyl-D-alanine carboxypeptidase (penicillin-binding protein 5/6) [Tranquillimonas rosea]
MTHRITAALAAIAMAALTALPAQAFETTARAAYVYDMTTGTELLAKNANEPLPPASMSKLMTLNMLFEALHDGRVTMDTRFGVSSHAASMGGSTMYLDERDRPTVEQLIQGIIVQSGNDACVVVAEGLAGTEDAFADLMNERAEDIGLDDSHFANASGWPDPEHRMSMEDLATVAARLVTEFPELYGYFAQKEFGFDGRAPQNRFNRNPLLGLGIGADGLKTGHTQEAGYGLVGSAAQGDRRVVFVLSGLDSAGARAQESERIVNWAFRQFVEKTVAEEGQRVATADVWLGNTNEVELVVSENVSMLVPATKQDDITARAVFDSPIEAPLAAGQKIGELVITLEGLPETRVPLTTAEAVPRGGFVPRLKTAAGVLMRRWGVEAQPLQ